jgi:DNA-binding NarL/FixJ family response regulator
MATTRAFIIDDHPIVRNVLRTLLERAEIDVVGEAAELDDGLRKARRLRPDVVILDSVLPETNGLEALAVLVRALPRSRIVYLGADSDPHYERAAIDAGAAGYVWKDETDTRIVALVRSLGAERPPGRRRARGIAGRFPGSNAAGTAHAR